MRAFLIILTLIFVAAHPAHAQEEETIPSPSDYMVDRPDYEPGTPYYLNVKSRWAFGLRFALTGVPVPGALGNTFQIYGERMFQTFGFGYLSFGGHLGTFPLFLPSAQIPYPNYANAIVGAQLRYQLKFSKDALIVPTAAVEWEFYQIKESSFDDNILSGSDLGLSFGIMINAGFIDRMTEREAHRSIGLTRAYLTAELRSANINNALFSLVGNYWLIGFRLELE